MKKVYLLIGLIAAFSVFAFGTTVLAGDFGLKDTARAAKLDTYGDSVPTIAGNVIGTLLSMISVLFFVLVLYGGILWMTARGSSENTEKALNTIIAATIGIIIVMGAYALTNFVFKLGGNAGGGNNQSGQNNSSGSAVCGNAIIEASEACDDGGTASGDGCSASCAQIESGWTCDNSEPQEGSACVSSGGAPLVAQCGDGFPDEGEECDDGPNGSERCSSLCKIKSCQPKQDACENRVATCSVHPTSFYCLSSTHSSGASLCNAFTNSPCQTLSRDECTTSAPSSGVYCEVR